MKRCRCTIVAITVEDPHTARVICPIHGSHYLFRREDGKWETETQRRKRLELLRVCESCEQEYQLPFKSHGNIATRFCPKCDAIRSSRRSREAYVASTGGCRRNNPNSPWRKFVLYKEII